MRQRVLGHLVHPHLKRTHPSHRRRILIRCGLPPGDIVLLTGAVRDLLAAHPGELAIDVRTTAPDLWHFHPGLTALEEGDPTVETVEVHMPGTTDCNTRPIHLQTWLLDELNRKLGTRAVPTAFHGEVFLPPSDWKRPSPLRELTGSEMPFWIVAAGGKHDHRIKWWSARRYQQVVDHFRDRIQFVQIGAPGDHHPALEGVIDLRGKTSIRELVRWMAHAQGVLCGITFAMHLAAAVPNTATRQFGRPCVVVAGGREPLHWFAYPGHQVLCNVGQLPCSGSGCWKSRTEPAGDGSEWDHPSRICSQHVDGLARCMDLIQAPDVIRRIEGYFLGGQARFLTPVESELVRPFRSSSSTAAKDQPNPIPHPPGVEVPGSRLCVLTVCDEGMTDVGRETIPLMEAYAGRHGFHFECVRQRLVRDRHPAWSKIPALLRLLESGLFDWVFWVDADAAILNPAIDIRSLLPAGKDLLFASDFNGLCAGVFAARACNWTIDFFRAVWGAGTLGHDPDGMGDKWEQTTIKHLLAHFPEHSPHVAFARDTDMNSSWSAYRPGHFIVHLGAMSNADRLRMLRGIQDEATDGRAKERSDWSDHSWYEYRCRHLGAPHGTGSEAVVRTRLVS